MSGIISICIRPKTVDICLTREATTRPKAVRQAPSNSIWATSVTSITGS
jgi:hypothetical protein